MLIKIIDSTSYHFAIASVPTFITTIALLLLGIWVIIRERGTKISYSFFLIILSIDLWLFAFSFMYCVNTPEIAFWWAKAAYLGVPFIATTIYHFTVIVLGIYQRRKIIIWASWLLSIFFAITILTSKALINSVYHYWWGYYPRYGWLSTPFLIFFFGLLILSLYDYWREYKKATPDTLYHSRVKAFMIAFSIAYLGSVDYLAKFGIPLYPFGYIPLLIFLVVAANAMKRYRLVDLTPAFAANKILTTMADPLIVCDLENKIRVVNDATCNIFGYSKNELIGKSITELAIFTSESIKKYFMEVLKNELIKERQFLFHTKDNNIVNVSISISKLRDQHHTDVGTVVIARDIRQQKHMEMQLSYLANHDPLTGLYNRRRFEEELDRTITLSKRIHTSNALLWFDIDRFKEINDSYGHQFGDKILIHLTTLLQKRLRKTDIISRLGGDEFAVILSNTNKETLPAIINELLKIVEQENINIEGHSLRITVSMGVVIFPEQGDKKENLLTFADMALYQAKEAGRNRYVIYSPEKGWQAPIESRVVWARRIREALEKDHFLLYAQPIINLENDKISFYEMLLRMKAETGEIIPPSVYLEIAERYGFMQEINYWVVVHTIKFLAQQQKENKHLVITCNLSGKVLADTKFLIILKEELKKNNITPKSLVFEITENSIVSNFAEAKDFIMECKKLGCLFALDDFGVGLSSFAHLKFLPVDFIKIDGSFIRNLAVDKLNQRFIKAIVDIAQPLGKETIAEYVEEKETVKILKRLGVNYGQGFYFSKPKPWPAILENDSGMPDKDISV